MSAYLVFIKKDSNSLISRLVSYVSKSPYSHAGVLINGVFYDASEARGAVGIDHTLRGTYKNRDVTIYETPDATPYVRGWARGQVGRAYDYYGVLGWIFSVGNKRRVYCFEWVLEFYLAETFIFGTDYGMNITAELIIDKMMTTPIFEGLGGDFNVQG